ncbi:hypothetical protein DSO57_1021489 [Entomophthora muscae]|uniref:Uncharacterized protein n=1 Tax=Entomophthora muscae TaxID=34485 RepID=A0ACC2UPB3_9FUNG|nr:hypothetical protein DSO57_1021489 [Entomophthora muscae]
MGIVDKKYGFLDFVKVMYVALTLVATVSLMLNVLLLRVNYRRKVWAVDVVLMSLIAAVDIVADCFQILTQILHEATDGKVAQSDNWWCYSSMILLRALGVAAIDLTALLALVRYIAIVKGRSLRANRWVWSGAGIVGSLLVIFVIRLNISRLQLVPSDMHCVFAWKKPSVANRILNVLISVYIMPPIIVIPFCYFSIVRHYNILLDAIQSDCMSCTEKASRGKIKVLFVIVIAYMLAVLPEYAMTLAHIVYKAETSPALDAITKVLYSCSNILNASLALVAHDGIYSELASQEINPSNI